MKHIAAAITLGLLLSHSCPAAAQEILSTVTVTAERVALAPTTRPALLLPLYAGTIALQAYDGYSTLTAVHANGVELNPVVGGITGHPAMFIAVKGASAALSIYASERLWKTGHRGQAIATLLVTNAVMTAVAVNNARVLGSIR
jgi:hypothetical protein